MLVNDLADFAERLLVIHRRHLVDLLAVNSLVGFQVDDRTSIGDGEDSGVVLLCVAGVVYPCERDVRTQQHEQGSSFQHSPPYLPFASASALRLANVSSTSFMPSTEHPAAARWRLPSLP